GSSPSAPCCRPSSRRPTSTTPTRPAPPVRGPRLLPVRFVSCPPRSSLRQQVLHGKVVGPARRAHLAPRAVVGILVRSEADELRPVAEAVLLELVEAHLDDELGLERRLLQTVRAPAVRLREAPLALLVEQRQHRLRDLVLVARADGARAD